MTLLLLLLACADPPAETAAPAADTGPVDRDCDGVPADQDCDDLDDDRGLAPTFYADADGDGFGDPSAPLSACERPEGAVRDATDCDDADPASSPEGVERCGGGDEDCDGRVDEDDDSLSDAVALWVDADGDGYGGEEAVEGCPGEGLSTESGDCDDADPARLPGEGCRPESDCAHADVDTLAAVANLSISDILIDDDCNTWLPNVVTYDSVQVIHPSGVQLAEFDTWDVWCDLPAIAMDPDDGDVWIMGTDNTYAIVGRIGEDAVEHVADGVFTRGTSWIGTYMNWVAQSIASDGTCLWVPNFAGNGSVVCVLEDGSQSTLLTLEERVETVAIDPDGALWASSGASVYRLDTSAGEAERVWTFEANVLDMVFDYDGSAYVETTGDQLLHAQTDGSYTVFASVSYDGKLAISPDGWLVRVMPYWDGGLADVASRWEEWPLDD